MITYRNRQIEDYFIDKNTAVITDKLGNVQDVCIRNGRRYFKSMPIYVIMMHTYKGFKEGLDIHHKDRNKLNDALNNLIYLEPSIHSSMHMKGKKIRLGKHQSEEARRKISEGNKGKIISQECREKIRLKALGENNPNYGKHLSENQRKKLSDAAEGHHWYNNGKEELHCRECPDGFVHGRLKK